MKLERFKQPLIDFLKGSAVKYALKKLLGSAVMGGFKAWLVRYIVVELFEEVAEPLIRLAIRKGVLVYDKIEGNIKIKRLEKAKESGNESDYNDTIDNL